MTCSLLLDRLNERNGQTLTELCAGLDMARQSVSKHLAVLEAANLITTTANFTEPQPLAGVTRLIRADLAECRFSAYLVCPRLQPGGAVLKAISGGWPVVVSKLKTLLETEEAEAPVSATR